MVSDGLAHVWGDWQAGGLKRASARTACLGPMWSLIVQQLAWASSHGGLGVLKAAKEDEP